jgi:hypothetical protein
VNETFFDAPLTFLNLEFWILLIYNLITGEGATQVPESLREFWTYFQIGAFVLSFLFIVGIVYSATRIYQIRRDEREAYLAASAPRPTGEDYINEKWADVLENLASENPAMWRLAIIEADVMLESVVEKMNLPGDTLGERMSAVDKSDFNTIDMAWEAHKVRNSIAHEGSDFILTQREARRVIDLYRQVFEEFHII